MDSSKRHWPSMFKSKTSINSHGHHWQHDISPPISTTATSNSHRPSAISSVTEERTPDPKPRWNPKPEQIRILEGIFNSGMINPPRDEIRRIRAQLQEYGQVGDANVFYWFQNRKSRSKNKKSNFQNSTTKSQRRTLSPLATSNTVPFSYTSSSSDKSLQKSADRKDFSSNIVWDGLNLSPSCSVNQPYFCKTTSPGELLPEPYFFPGSQTTLVGGATAGASVGTPLTLGFSFPEVISTNDYVAHNNNNVSQYHGQTFGKCSTSLFLTDLMNLEAMDNYYKRVEDNDKIKMQQQLSYSCVTTATPISTQTIHPPTVSPTVMSTINHIQGAGEGLKKSTVFINDVAVEVASGPFDVREAFGEDAVLIHYSGQPVVTNEWGVTLQSLQHGAFYYLVRMITPPPPSQSHSSIHLI